MLDKYLQIKSFKKGTKDITKPQDIFTQNSKNPFPSQGRGLGYSKKEIFSTISRHRNFSQQILRIIHRIPEIYFLNNHSVEAKKINKMIKEVELEAYRAIQFTRTQLNNHGVLYGNIFLQHRVEDKVLSFFHERWPQCQICLFNKFRQSTYIINEEGEIQVVKEDLTKVVENLSCKRLIQPFFEDIKVKNEKMFEALYTSQFISSRANRSYFKKMIPQKCMTLPGMKGGVEARFRNQTFLFDEKPALQMAHHGKSKYKRNNKKESVKKKRKKTR